MKIAVIGAGVMGLATAWALKRRGYEPIVYEQFAVGHDRGSSHGRSRIFRLAYAEDHYVRLAQEALTLWRELEAESGETVLELPGLVEVVQTLEESTAHTLERCGVAWERLEREEAERRYPIRVPEGSFVVVQPEAGIARADKALAAFARELDIREHTRAHPDEVDADAVVVTAGPWVNELLDEPLPVKTTRETLCYFRLDGERPIPSVVSFKPGRHTHEMYSLHDPEYGLKVGAHHAGPEADPNVPGRAGAGADRADRDLGGCDLSTRRHDTGRGRDVHVHDHRGRDVHPRAPRPDRHRLAVLWPRLQVRAGDRRAARRPRGRSGRLTILRACPRTSFEATFRASGTSSSATTGGC